MTKEFKHRNRLYVVSNVTRGFFGRYNVNGISLPDSYAANVWDYCLPCDDGDKSYCKERTRILKWLERYVTDSANS